MFPYNTSPFKPVVWQLNRGGTLAGGTLARRGDGGLGLVVYVVGSGRALLGWFVMLWSGVVLLLVALVMIERFVYWGIDVGVTVVVEWW